MQSVESYVKMPASHITRHALNASKSTASPLKDPEDFLTIKGLQIHSGEEQDESILQADNEDGRDEAEFRYLCNKQTTPPTITATAVSAATDEGTATANLSTEMDLYRVVVMTIPQRKMK